MKACACIFLSVVMAVSAQLTPSAPGPFLCHSNADCAPNECCSMRPKVMVLSKKRDVGIDTDFYHSSQCEPYLAENATCLDVTYANGDCGCAPGFSCQYVAERDRFPEPHDLEYIRLSKRKRMIQMRGDWAAHVCTREQLVPPS